MDIRAVVVDDDPSSARAITKLLQQVGCEVQTCTDPVSAVEIALDSDVDVVSLDIKMPRLDGFEVLSLIRSHEHSRRVPSVPVIAITGSVAMEDKAFAISSGFASHVGKPVMLHDLQAMLDTVAALRGSLYRTRYSADQEAIAARVDQLMSGAAAADDSQAVTGLALAMEQQGADLMRQMLTGAYQRDFEAAAAAAARLGGVGEAIGASHFAALCGRFIESLGKDSARFERQAVLARAELDRVVYTLRERVLS